MSTQPSETQGNTQLPPPVTYMIGGVQVHFPTKAYPSQIAMMNKVIQGLKTKQNCLLESPTGSGKSLALLCASLAWQRHEAERVEKYNAEIDERERLKTNEKLLKSQHKKTEDFCGKNGCNTPAQETGKEDVWVKGSSSNFEVLLTDDEDDFQPPKRAKPSSTPPREQGDCKFQTPKHPEFDKCRSTSPSNEPEEPFSCPQADKKLSVPKIYFGTRTHKQIAQITRELRKTEYKSARSVILASREYTCVNPTVANQPNKNDACKELLDNANLDGGGCIWHTSAKKVGTFSYLSHAGLRPGYDLEEFVQLGRDHRACPYYATRNMMPTADIIFCPYNYLVEQHIRKSMSIELSGQVVIFDEAHNMEDSSREAASSSIAQEDIQAAMQDCEKVARLWIGDLETSHTELAQLLSALSRWMDAEAKGMTELDFSNEGKHWNGTQFFAAMTNAGIAEMLHSCEAQFKEIVRQREMQLELMKDRGRVKPAELAKRPIISSATVMVVEHVYRVFEYLERENAKYRDDFCVALLKSTIRRRRNVHEPNVSRNIINLNFWCLNPAVSFGTLKDEVHSIILTSGTLSPIQSFQSELGTPFPIKLEANHVIDRNQVYASVISCGPSNKTLNGSYQSVETYQYQDELGDLVARVCRLVPHGVLCFFPSYRLLEKVKERWQMTRCWDSIENIKDIYIEPRSGNAAFQEIISSFYSSIEETNDQPRGTITGAVFMAVCRGKVSEGLDFADNNARAVICIGIPFPNFKDLQVGLKREYNEKNRSRGLLSGGDWYEIQAFRALNQALGRCIRHRYDWGAILLVDERFQKSPRYVNSLSRWVRSSVRPFDSWSEMEDGLVEFRDQMLLAMPRPMKTSKEIDIDLPSEANENSQHPGVFFGNNHSASSENGHLPRISDRFSSGRGIPTSTLDSKARGVKSSTVSPYFGKKNPPEQKLYSIFSPLPAKKKLKTSNTGSSRNPITFDEED